MRKPMKRKRAITGFTSDELFLIYEWARCNSPKPGVRGHNTELALSIASKIREAEGW